MKTRNHPDTFPARFLGGIEFAEPGELRGGQASRWDRCQGCGDLAIGIHGTLGRKSQSLKGYETR